MSYFVNKEKNLPAQEVWPGIVGHLIHTEQSTIADFRIAAGVVLPEHAHPHEQTSTVLEGTFRFVVGDEERICGPGDVAVIPGDVPHLGEAITDCRILDVFAPVREDYRIER
ncbi:MAG: cupin domain-containing protein [Bacteroidota bacterium]